MHESMLLSFTYTSATNSCGVPIHKVQAFTWLSQHPHGAQTSLTSLTICCINVVFFCCVQGGERLTFWYSDPNVLNKTKQG